ncbi:hypothetical protein D9M70_493760 [compost metagenome]
MLAGALIAIVTMRAANRRIMGELKAPWWMLTLGGATIVATAEMSLLQKGRRGADIPLSSFGVVRGADFRAAEMSINSLRAFCRAKSGSGMMPGACM